MECKERLVSIVLLFAMGLVFSLNSCKPAKKIQAAISKKDTMGLVVVHSSAADSIAIIQKAMAGIREKEPHYKTFSAKIKVEYQDSKGKQPGITAFVRIIKDSVIWISGYATLFNIEAFRVYVNRDSVFVLDKINKEVQYRSIDYLQEVTQIPFDFKTLQDLLVGNPIFLTDSVISYKETESRILLATLGANFKHLLTLNKADKLIIHSTLDDVNVNRNRTADITYDEFENSNGSLFSTYREITVSEKNKLDIQLKYKQFEFDKELQLNFNIPKNYKRM